MPKKMKMKRKRSTSINESELIMGTSEENNINPVTCKNIDAGDSNFDSETKSLFV